MIISRPPANWIVQSRSHDLDQIQFTVILYPLGSLQPLWKGVTATGERVEAKLALSELARKAEYKKNPRYKSSTLSNTAAYGKLNEGKLPLGLKLVGLENPLIQCKKL